MNNKLTLDDIVSEVQKKYMHYDESVKSDIIEVLDRFWKYGIIVWEGNNPARDKVNISMHGISITKADNDDAKTVLQLVRNSKYKSAMMWDSKISMNVIHTYLLHDVLDFYICSSDPNQQYLVVCSRETKYIELLVTNCPDPSILQSTLKLLLDYKQAIGFICLIDSN